MSAPAARRQLSQRAQIAVAVAAALLVAALGWFLLVSPKRAQSAELDVEIAAAQAQLTEARRASLAPPEERIETADIFRLAKAMPGQLDMAGILLELGRIAAEAGIEFKTITPGGPLAAESYNLVPISLEFEGNFYGLSDFLFRLRSMVRVSKGELSATGRLFSVSTLSFSPAEEGFPEIAAQLTVNAYVYGAATQTPAPPPVPPTETAAPEAESDEPEEPAPAPETPTADAASAGGGS